MQQRARLAVPIRLRRRINQIIHDFKPDVIHVQDHFLICKTAVEVGRDNGIPVMATNHLMPENFTAFLHWKYLNSRFEAFLWKGLADVFNQTRIVTTPSESGVRLIKSKLKVEAIPVSNGVSLEKFNPSGDPRVIREKYGIPDIPILLYVGRLDPEKHIEEILKAVVGALKNIDFRFVVVGKGTIKNNLEQLASQLGISDKVIFTGFVPDEELPYFYKISRCFVIASTAELLSLVTLQAMASGLPVIAVRAGALTELVRDRLNGFLYNEGDIPEIVRHIQEIMVDDDLCRRMSEKSLVFAREHDINKVVETFENLYSRLIKENGVFVETDQAEITVDHY
jgi:glycosyltransferase involved in cell wall biosynthesis